LHTATSIKLKGSWCYYCSFCWEFSL